MNIDLKKTDFDGVIDNFHKELSKLRTGRASPTMIEDLKVDYYGSKMIIKQIATISVPEPRQLLVQAWDKNALGPMEKTIRDSGLGLNPTNEGDKLRITLPELTEETRKDLSKVAGKLAEEARIKLRNIREDIQKQIKKDEEAGDISEDEKFRKQEKLQQMVEEYNKKIKDLAEAKEKDIMTV
ncbi:ribosome recycling factor [bacterium]|nr:MAG: ribosome recycling factor [bacterium]